MLNFNLKSSILLAAMVSIPLQAQDYEVEDILPQQTPSEMFEKNTSETSDTLASKSAKEVLDTEDILATDQISQPIEKDSKSEDTLVNDPVSQPIEESYESEGTLINDQVSQSIEEGSESEGTLVNDQVSQPVEKGSESEGTLVNDQVSQPVEESSESESTLLVNDQVSQPNEESSESESTLLVNDQVSQPNEESSESESTLLVNNQVSQPNNTGTLSPSCPADFYTLPLYPNAKFCQLFAQGLPASMSYFAISDPQSAKDFYITQLGKAEDEKTLKGRIVLQYSNGQKVVVISKDGQGSQIDILIKSAG